MSMINNLAKIPLIILRLEGDFQSFGTQGKWYIRETDPEPSKSAIIGMIGNAMGLKKFDPKLVELEQKLELAIRIDREGTVIEDYHTIQKGSRSANHKFSDNPLLTTRTYLQNASFLVIVKSKTNDKSYLESIANAFQNPKRPIYIGRKCCIPTKPVFQALKEQYTSMEEAIRNEPWESSYDEKPPQFLTATIEDPSGEFLRKDVYLGTPSENKGYRNVRQIHIQTSSLPMNNNSLNTYNTKNNGKNP